MRLLLIVLLGFAFNAYASTFSSGQATITGQPNMTANPAPFAQQGSKNYQSTYETYEISIHDNLLSQREFANTKDYSCGELFLGFLVIVGVFIAFCFVVFGILYLGVLLDL
jgi:hypothetical protein